MKRLWQRAGTATFWLAWPGLWLYLRWSRRARVLVVCEDRVLLVKGWLSDGSWELPGGGRQPGETSLRAVRRELREETGIDLPDKTFALHGASTFRSHGLSFRYDLFIAKVTECFPIRQRPLEISQAGWFNHSEARQLKLGPDVVAALRVWSS
ncbi:MAG TPA: NUDIX hydrolase [Verrucomicrobiae bacterium]|jgi:8-oxo-dGTP pyrophosphatase MutT (NUDIX family)|nr:NUDIX hydrolase [Verrucomicrobiae bacterium]